jgi:leader peptidase (prepilin peptidase)/N-methyltransferase
MDLAFALVFGLIVGSFLNVCIVRIPEGASIVTPRSRCPKCKQPIAWYDNIPVLSYLALGGRCRHCKKKIAPLYPFIEALNGLISVLLYVRFGLGLEWAIFLGFCSALLVLAVIDVNERILPDPITLNGIWAGILVSIALAQPNPFMARLLRFVGLEITNPRVVALAASLLGIAVGGGLLWLVAEAYLRLRGIEGMGFGDVKMMAMVGAFLGAPLALFTIMIGSLLGSVIGLAFIRLNKKSRDYELPFGTFLAAAAIIAVLYGNELIQLYIDRMIRPVV